MTVRTRRLAFAAGEVPTAETALFTVPADRTAIVKSVMLGHQSGATGAIQVRLRTAGQSIRAVQQTLAAGETWSREGLFWVMHEGDSLGWLAAAAGSTLRIWVSGSLLLGDPQ